LLCGSLGVAAVGRPRRKKKRSHWVRKYSKKGSTGKDCTDLAYKEMKRRAG